MNLIAFAEEQTTKTISLQQLWEDIVNFFKNSIWNIILFVFVFLAGYFLIKGVLAIIRKALGRSKMERIAQTFIINIIKYLLYLIFVLVLLSILGIEVNGIITALSAAVLAIGMALQNNIANLANGIIIVSMKMFKKGDYISVDNVAGIVEDINFLFTTINTYDNKKVTVPNSHIVNNPLTNYTANDLRRVEFNFSVAYDSDVALVSKVAVDTMLTCGKVKTDPAPACKLCKLNESGIEFFTSCWCKADDYWDVYYYVMGNVFNEFKRNGISIPYNQMEVRLRTDSVTMPVVGENPPQRPEEPAVVEEEPKHDNLLHIRHRDDKNKKNKKKGGKNKSKQTDETPETNDETNQ